MQAATSDFINLSAFSKAIAEQLVESLSGRIASKRVFNLVEAAEYCGLTRDSFKKRVVRDRLRKLRLDKCWRFDKAGLDAWIDNHQRENHRGKSSMSKRRAKPTKRQGGVFPIFGRPICRFPIGMTKGKFASQLA